MSVDIEVRGTVAEIVLNRPEAMNSIDPETRAMLHAAWERVNTDESIRVALITGAGDRAFCTGSDLKRTMPPAESYAQIAFGDGGDHLLKGFPRDKPVIAAINGYAIGGGLEIALACDIRICSETAQFGLAEVQIGSIPGAGGTQRLTRMIGRSTAMQMLLTGDRIDAAEAHRVGLVSEVLPAGELLRRAREVADRIARNAPLAVRAVKRLATEGPDLPLERGLDLESYVWGLLRDTEDRIEGRKAFAEKRAPRFQGR
ncbi:enoyl-CoA hydratase/isomerase family protein [Nonomuraea sp. K274]|uniref:enoyl-CoA hydratase n=1 Tax=Nonomuraea cypriaca TaxID=1187855 RepID=A0A931A4S3_9ACTN|nr:enoyl-CoA hydratase-related protein [Nonomuraea cypriaca]MBF8185010.1 enoyl-CoA hydratase/isomerase family protein [Nonomuraea cypriaca]